MTDTTLAAQQKAFMSLLLDDSQPLPAAWEARRVEIYRNAYRARLVDALRETYPGTARWVGSSAFAQAAAHHAISHPPASWTLDAVGEGFSDTLATLFGKDPEVSELAWLEWAMHVCFVSYDATPMDAAGFTAVTGGFTADDWAAMHLRFLPGTQQASVEHRVDRLWRALTQAGTGSAEKSPQESTERSTAEIAAHARNPDTSTTAAAGGASQSDTKAAGAMDFSSDEPLACIVWRRGFTPAFAPVSATEGRALALLLDGAGYGELCGLLVDELGEEHAATEAGAMLGRWLHRGMIVGVSLGA